MGNVLLTKVVTELVNRKDNAQEYGVSLINLTDFNYVQFVSNLSSNRSISVFFLGFSTDAVDDLRSNLPSIANITYSYTVEAAEEARNNGDESLFRVLIIKRAEIEKLSSLRWFPEITVDKVYDQSCIMLLNKLNNSNAVIDSLIRALKRKAIRNILGFERVLEYLDTLLAADSESLPNILTDKFYKLGLCTDGELDNNNPSVEDFVNKIKRNHAIVERISSLEQAERQSITNYYAENTSNKEIPRLILQFYKTKNVELLGKMELSDVENCLKAVKKRSRTTTPQRKNSYVKPTAMASQLIFDNNIQQIKDTLEQIEQDIDHRATSGKSDRIDIDVNGQKMQIKVEPVTEKIADELTDIEDFGGIILADVSSPDEAIIDIDKFNYTPFKIDLLNIVWDNLRKISILLSEGETITESLKQYINARNKILEFKRRLQDTPMFPILSNKDLFLGYLKSYEKLLISINDDFPKIWKIAPSNAKEIINIIMSLDNIFIIGERNCHSIPTPLNPLYLWKYIKLSEEILESKGVDDCEQNSLSEDDKTFIIRKAEDIPDPLSVMLLPATVSQRGALFLPLSGRVGNLPIYSTNKQINQSESGIESLKQAIIRYLCLYPHAGMMLRLAVIDPPSVELMVYMLKMLNNDREFNISGIEVSIYRTKEASADWIEIDDDSLNEGMLGKIKGKRNLNFRLRIANKKTAYSKIIHEIQDEQHIMIIFDPNEVRIEKAQNNKQIHIHPLCIPKVYQYNPVDEKVEIRPANEGDIFTTYASIIEKLNEHPSTFSHTSTYFNTPLKRDTYDEMLEKADWLVILDQSLKNWDISLRVASEKLYYKENDYRSMGIYSKNCKKFIMGYNDTIRKLGNFIPQEKGVENIIESIREINDDGLLSIVSHSSNRIFDFNHGKGSLGLSIAAISYKRKNPDAILVGLDAQLAKEWLSSRDDNKLPDLVGIRLISEFDAVIDIVEVKTYTDNPNAFTLQGEYIIGNAVEQVTVLEDLIREMFGNTEKITTVSRKEILREQVFEALFQADLDPNMKHRMSEKLNSLFAGEYKIEVNKIITFVDFNNSDSRNEIFKGKDGFEGEIYYLSTIGSKEIQAIISDTVYMEGFKVNPNQDIVDASVNLEETKPSKSEPLQALETKADLKTKETISEKTETVEDTVDKKELEEKCNKLNKVFRDYGISAFPVDPELAQEAARFTRFSVELKSGETVRSIEKYKADIGIQLEANGEILINHIRGTKYISVDVPFVRELKTISLINYLHLLDDSSGKLNTIAGQQPDGKFEILDISKAPHLLVAGTTGSGKTIFLYSIIVSLLKQFSADELELLIIDPKQTDFTFFDDLPNLYGGHVITDSVEALEMIKRINEKDKEERTITLKSNRSRDIDSYNGKNPVTKMKRLVVVIDEYADLIQTAEMQGNRKEFEKLLIMLAQRVRNLGIHLVIATQRPTANIVTGALKANIPYRVSFRLPSHTDSQTILDMSGAENLLGKGDMLMVTDSDVKRMQGLFITEEELTDFLEGYDKNE